MAQLVPEKISDWWAKRLISTGTAPFDSSALPRTPLQFCLFSYHRTAVPTCVAYGPLIDEFQPA